MARFTSYGVDIVDYPEEVVGGLTLRQISQKEVTLFNMDLDGIVSASINPQIREAFESYTNQIFRTVRNVMYWARQPYGGPIGSQDEIVIRAIRPIDVKGSTGSPTDVWDTTLSSVTNIPVAQAKVDAIVMGDFDGLVIVGFAETAADPSMFTAWQAVKGGVTYPYLALKFTTSSRDYAPFMKCQVPVSAYPQETLTLNFAAARTGTPTSYAEVIGVAISKATTFRTVIGTPCD